LAKNQAFLIPSFCITRIKFESLVIASNGFKAIALFVERKAFAVSGFYMFRIKSNSRFITFDGLFVFSQLTENHSFVTPSHGKFWLKLLGLYRNI